MRLAERQDKGGWNQSPSPAKSSCGIRQINAPHLQIEQRPIDSLPADINLNCLVDKFSGSLTAGFINVFGKITAAGIHLSQSA